MPIVTVPPMIRSSSVGAAWPSPDLTMPPRWGLRRFCLDAGNRPTSSKESPRKTAPDRLTEAYLPGPIYGLTPFPNAAGPS